MKKYFFNEAIFYFALKSLQHNRLSAFLSAFGICIGISSYIVLMGITKGKEKENDELFSTIGSRNVFVSFSPSVQTKDGNYLLIDRSINNFKKSINSIKDFAWEYSQEIQLYTNNSIINTTVIGISENYFSLFNKDLKSGFEFDQQQIKSAVSVCILGSQIATNLFGYENPMGKFVKIKKSWYEVVGLAGSENETDISKYGMNNPSKSIFIPYTTFLARINLKVNNVVSQLANETLPKERKKESNKLIIEISDEKFMSETLSFISQEFNHIIAGENSFTILSADDVIKSKNKSTELFQAILWCISVISILSGCVGIANMMYESYKHRIHEIGIRMSVGASEYDIKNQFLTEAIFISIGGALIGIFFGLILLFIIENLFGLRIEYSLIVILVSFIFSVSAGVISGYFPAHKASKLNPIESLRR